jgi:hypothetical protein
LRYANANRNGGENGYGPSGVSSVPRGAVGGGLILMFGAALLKLALYLLDAPRNPIWRRIFSWGCIVIGGGLIAHGTVLFIGKLALNILQFDGLRHDCN